MTEPKQLQKLPSISDLYKAEDKMVLAATNQLNLLLNYEPKKEWLKDHPLATKKVAGKYVPCTYIPIERLEWLLTNIFVSWHVEIKGIQLIANSVVCSVRLHYRNPIDGEMLWQDGIGAAPLQTDKGAGAADWNAIKANAVQIAAPAAESYAIKDAAEKIGKLFGKDLNRADQIAYDNLSAKFKEIDIRELEMLLVDKEFSLTPEEYQSARRIIDENEKNSFEKLHTLLKSKPSKNNYENGNNPK